MPRKKKELLVGEGMNANLLKQFIDYSYLGNTSIAPEGYTIDAPLSDSRVKVYAKNGSNDKDIVVTHRGSVGLDDWMDNASYLFRGKVKGTKTYNLHRERHKKAVEKYGAKNITAIGHSRAGLYLQELQKEFPIKENITYNKASGFFDIGRKNDANQTDIRVGNDIVSLLAPLQNRPNEIVKIDNTKNPFDFNTAHQSSEIDKLGTTFIGKKEEAEGGAIKRKRGRPKKLVGKGDKPTPTYEELMSKLITMTIRPLPPPIPANRPPREGFEPVKPLPPHNPTLLPIKEGNAYDTPARPLLRPIPSEKEIDNIMKELKKRVDKQTKLVLSTKDMNERMRQVIKSGATLEELVAFWNNPPSSRASSSGASSSVEGSGIQPRISGVEQIRKLLGVEQRRLERMRKGTTEYHSKYITEPKTLEKISRLKERLKSAENNQGHATEDFFVPKTATWLKINKNETYLNTPLKADGKHKLMLTEIDKRIEEIKAKKTKKATKTETAENVVIVEEIKQEINKAEEVLQAKAEEPKKKLTKEEHKKARLAKKAEYDRLRYLQIKAKKLEALAKTTTAEKQVEKVEEKVEAFKEEVKEFVDDVEEEEDFYKKPLLQTFHFQFVGDDKELILVLNSSVITDINFKVIGYLHSDGGIYSSLDEYNETALLEKKKFKDKTYLCYEEVAFTFDKTTRKLEYAGILRKNSLDNSPFARPYGLRGERVSKKVYAELMKKYDEGTAYGGMINAEAEDVFDTFKPKKVSKKNLKLITKPKKVSEENLTQQEGYDDEFDTIKKRQDEEIEELIRRGRQGREAQRQDDLTERRRYDEADNLIWDIIRPYNLQRGTENMRNFWYIIEMIRESNDIVEVPTSYVKRVVEGIVNEGDDSRFDVMSFNLNPRDDSRGNDDTEPTIGSGIHNQYSYLDNIINNDTTSQNLTIHLYKSNPKYIKSLIGGMINQEQDELAQFNSEVISINDEIEILEEKQKNSQNRLKKILKKFKDLEEQRNFIKWRIENTPDLDIGIIQAMNIQVEQLTDALIEVNNDVKILSGEIKDFIDSIASLNRGKASYLKMIARIIEKRQKQNPTASSSSVASSSTTPLQEEPTLPNIGDLKITEPNKPNTEEPKTGGALYNQHSYLDNILDNNTTHQNLIIHREHFNSVPKYIKSLVGD